VFRADIRILLKDSKKIVKEDFIANLGKGDIFNCDRKFYCKTGRSRFRKLLHKF